MIIKPFSLFSFYLILLFLILISKKCAFIFLREFLPGMKHHMSIFLTIFIRTVINIPSINLAQRYSSDAINSSLWKDADPGIAEVEDVRERLVGLRE
jgi:hypothetical protein